MNIGMQSGYWLGIDVGSARDKVLNFALITADSAGAVSVCFERGAVRGPERARWPRAASDYLDLDAPSWLSEPVTRGIDSVLDRSVLVQRWLEQSALGTEPCGVAIDAPGGFAASGRQRRTEAAAATSHATPTRDAFRADLVRFLDQHKDAPLFQRYIWKLVGLRAMHEIAARAGLAERKGPGWASVSSLCVSPRVAKGPFLREAFPSDTYARSNGKLAVLQDDARTALRYVMSAEWRFAGDTLSRVSSLPTAQNQRRLVERRGAILADLTAGAVALPSMRKVEKDPPWADLWDSLSCAFVACCETQRCAELVLGGSPAPRGEGAILSPVSG